MPSDLAVPLRPTHVCMPTPMTSAGVGGDSEQISRLREQAEKQIVSPYIVVEKSLRVPNINASLEERLFNARAACKLRTANVAMHLDQEWRRRFFAQLDSLMDFEEWDPADLPVSETSFTTLLRMILLIKAKRRPGLGAASNGNILASWTVGKDRLTIECLPCDQVRWGLLHVPDGEQERAAGQTAVTRLLHALAPYNPDRWFADERRQAPA
jgi:hypothetical protein